MSGLQLHCPNCGLRFPSSAIRIKEAHGLVFTNFKERCPRCGAMAAAESGTYDVTGGQWRALASALTPAEATRRDYEDLAQLLRTAQTLGMSEEAIASAVKAKVPHLANVGDLLLSAKSGTLAAWIAVVISVLAIILTVTGQAPATEVTVVVDQTGSRLTEEQVHQWIREAVREEFAAERAAAEKEQRQSTRKNTNPPKNR